MQELELRPELVEACAMRTRAREGRGTAGCSAAPRGAGCGTGPAAPRLRTSKTDTPDGLLTVLVLVPVVEQRREQPRAHLLQVECAKVLPGVPPGAGAGERRLQREAARRDTAWHGTAQHASRPSSWVHHRGMGGGGIVAVAAQRAPVDQAQLPEAHHAPRAGLGLLQAVSKQEIPQRALRLQAPDRDPSQP